jgi:hypothetical protein
MDMHFTLWFSGGSIRPSAAAAAAAAITHMLLLVQAPYVGSAGPTLL